jgi:hypothetical protein
MLGTSAGAAESREVIGSFEPACLKFPRLRFAKPKPEKSPYLTPIINDLDMLPPRKPREAAPTQATVRRPQGDTQGNEEEASCALQAPSVVEVTELERVRRAEQLILDEEQVHGIYSWSADGTHLVLSKPSAHMSPMRRKAPRRKQSPPQRQRAPQHGADGSEAGASPSRTSLSSTGTPKRVLPRLPMDAPDDPPALKRARKMGSDLFLVTAAGTTGRMKPAVRLERIGRLQQEAAYLEGEIAEYTRKRGVLQKEVEERQRALFPPDRSEAKGRGEEMEAEEGEMEEEDGALTDAGREELRGRLRELYAAVEQLNREIMSRRGELDFNGMVRGYFQQVKCQEGEEGKEEGGPGSRLALQRKRAALRDGEVLPEDEQLAMSIEDHCATQAQKLARGMIYRPAVAQRKVKMLRVAHILQALVRGYKGRQEAVLKVQRRLAATCIQAAWRAMRVRIAVRPIRESRMHAYAARPIQAFVRGHIGRRRAVKRREFVECSRAALEAVNHKGLVPEDLLELGDRLLRCLLNSSQPFPPPALLGLMRVIALMLGRPERPDCLTHFTLIGSCYRYVASTDQLSWSNAMRMLRRPSKLLRKLRALASDPLRSPPRVLHLPVACLELSARLKAAYPHDYTEAAMAAIGKGGRCAAGLMRYVLCLERVHAVQADFALSPETCLPLWLKRVRAAQKRRRELAVRAEVRRSGYAEARRALEARIVAELHYGVEKRVVEAELQGLGQGQGRLGRIEKELQRVEGQLQEEDAARLARLVGERRRLERAYHTIQHDRALAEGEALKGSRKARMLLKGLAEAEYRANEALRAKVQDVELCEDAIALHLRQAYGAPEYPEETVGLAQELGRESAQLQVAELYRDEYVAQIGGRYYVAELRGAAREAYDELDGRVKALEGRTADIKARMLAQAAAFEAGVHREDVETVLDDVCREKWDRPIESQLRSEAEEDEARAREEAMAGMQFLSPEVVAQLQEGYLGPEGRIVRSAPVLVALAIDTPRHIKDRVYAFLEEEFPGMFVRLGRQMIEGMSVTDYYYVFAEGKHVVAEFDAGWTFATRRAFLGTIFSLRRGLNPQPRCVLVTGTEFDKSGVVSHGPLASGCFALTSWCLVLIIFSCECRAATGWR